MTVRRPPARSAPARRPGAKDQTSSTAAQATASTKDTATKGTSTKGATAVPEGSRPRRGSGDRGAVGTVPPSRDMAAQRDIPVEQLWFRTRTIPWRSLAMVPLGAVDGAADLFDRFCHAASLNSGLTVEALRVDGLGPAGTANAVELLREGVRLQRLVVALTDSPGVNPSAIVIAREADATLLLVTPDARKADVAAAVDVIGPARIVGAVHVLGSTRR
jgi:hypothetical protein